MKRKHYTHKFDLGGSVLDLASSAISGAETVATGLNIAGKVYNTLFGSNLNEDFINQTESNIKNQAGYVSGATDNSGLLSDWSSHKNLSHVDQDDVGSDGIFSNKAKNKTKKLNKEIDEANTRAILSLVNTADALDKQNDFNVMSNYAANGGPIFMRNTGVMSPFGNRFGEGGDIHIKKANRGKFTDYCGGKVTSECIQKGLHSSNPTTRKRANFARNARKWKHAFGGDLLTHGAEWSNGVTYIGNGGTHEENPLEGVPMGIAPDGQPNLVEEGEVIFNDYVFSNRLKPSKEMKKKNKYKGDTFADIAKNLQKESEERPNDPISKRGLEDSMIKLQQSQEIIRQNNLSENTKFKYAYGGKMGMLFDGDGNKPNYLTYLRYAPVLGSAIGLGQNIFSKPDYTGVNTVLEAANDVEDYTPVEYTPIGNYLTYKPLDRNYYTNKLNAQANATRRAILNTTSPSRNAALLAADYNAQTKLGDLFRQAEEYNLAQRERVEGFNRQTNMANSEMRLKASMANQEAVLKAKSQRLSGVAQAMAMRDTIDSRRGASISANLTNLFDSLGSVGKEEFIKDMIENNPSLLYNWMGTYKDKKKSKGGYLTIKKRGK